MERGGSKRNAGLSTSSTGSAGVAVAGPSKRSAEQEDYQQCCSKDISKLNLATNFNYENYQKEKDLCETDFIDGFAFISFAHFSALDKVFKERMQEMCNETAGTAAVDDNSAPRYKKLGKRKNERRTTSNNSKNSIANNNNNKMMTEKIKNEKIVDETTTRIQQDSVFINNHSNNDTGTNSITVAQSQPQSQLSIPSVEDGPDTLSLIEQPKIDEDFIIKDDSPSTSLQTNVATVSTKSPPIASNTVNNNCMDTSGPDPALKAATSPPATNGKHKLKRDENHLDNNNSSSTINNSNVNVLDDDHDNAREFAKIPKLKLEDHCVQQLIIPTRALSPSMTNGSLTNGKPSSLLNRALQTFSSSSSSPSPATKNDKKQNLVAPKKELPASTSAETVTISNNNKHVPQQPLTLNSENHRVENIVCCSNSSSSSSASVMTSSVFNNNVKMTTTVHGSSTSTSIVSAADYFRQDHLHQQQPHPHHAQHLSRYPPFLPSMAVAADAATNGLLMPFANGSRLPLLPVDTQSAALFNPAANVLPIRRKGRWCALHVQIAWDIHKRSSQKRDKGTDTMLNVSLPNASVNSDRSCQNFQPSNCKDSLNSLPEHRSHSSSKDTQREKVHHSSSSHAEKASNSTRERDRQGSECNNVGHVGTSTYNNGSELKHNKHYQQTVTTIGQQSHVLPNTLNNCTPSNNSHYTSCPSSVNNCSQNNNMTINDGLLLRQKELQERIQANSLAAALGMRPGSGLPLYPVLGAPGGGLGPAENHLTAANVLHSQLNLLQSGAGLPLDLLRFRLSSMVPGPPPTGVGTLPDAYGRATSRDIYGAPSLTDTSNIFRQNLLLERDRSISMQQNAPHQQHQHLLQHLQQPPNQVTGAGFPAGMSAVPGGSPLIPVLDPDRLLNRLPPPTLNGAYSSLGGAPAPFDSQNALALYANFLQQQQQQQQQRDLVEQTRNRYLGLVPPTAVAPPPHHLLSNQNPDFLNRLFAFQSMTSAGPLAAADHRDLLARSLAAAVAAGGGVSAGSASQGATHQSSPLVGGASGGGGVNLLAAAAAAESNKLHSPFGATLQQMAQRDMLMNNSPVTSNAPAANPTHNLHNR